MRTEAGLILDKIRKLREKRNDPKQNIWVDNSYELETAQLLDELDDLLSGGADLPEAWQRRASA